MSGPEWVWFTTYALITGWAIYLNERRRRHERNGER